MSKLILIVDDNTDARFVFAAILDYDGYSVIEAANGERAVTNAIEYQPDLILMDIDMPVMDGLTAADIIRGHEKTRHIPMVAITGRAFSGDDEKRAAVLFDSCFIKPIAPRFVQDLVTRLIGPPR
jgi:two-component system cell cycle response regulator DivK